jgi:hypothetical protein
MKPQNSFKDPLALISNLNPSQTQNHFHVHSFRKINPRKKNPLLYNLKRMGFEESRAKNCVYIDRGYKFKCVIS